jgi:antitoxin VapB
MTKFAKLFRSGRSQAVRLPKEFQFQGSRVRILRVPTGILLQPLIDVNKWFAEMDKLGPERLRIRKRNPAVTPSRNMFD